MLWCSRPGARCAVCGNGPVLPSRMQARVRPIGGASGLGPPACSVPATLYLQPSRPRSTCSRLHARQTALPNLVLQLPPSAPEASLPPSSRCLPPSLLKGRLKNQPKPFLPQLLLAGCVGRAGRVASESGCGPRPFSQYPRLVPSHPQPLSSPPTRIPSPPREAGAEAPARRRAAAAAATPGPPTPRTCPPLPSRIRVT